MTALPGTRIDSTIQKVYQDLLDGKTLTSLSALYSHQTICLTKYVSDLRLKYGIDVKDTWLTLNNGKRVKRYFILK